MAKNYVVQFGSGNPSSLTGLTPTFIVFRAVPGGGLTTPPAIAEVASTGLYTFSYEPVGGVAFVIDGGAAITSVARYVAGNLDPVDAVDERIATLTGNVSTLSAFVPSIGTTADSFGSTLTDPSTVLGYLKRLLEFNEGNSIFSKASGTWQIFARGNATGASTGLIQKSVVDSGAVITKS